MKTLYALPIILAACAPQVPCDPATSRYGCERPTVTRGDNGPGHPARAWLLAILDALIQKEGENE